MITAKGSEVKNHINNADLKIKDEYISLKEGQGIKVRVLGVDDYVEYMSHGAYNLDIFTQPCPNPQAGDCVYCKAGKSSVEGFDVLKAKPRYLFAFANLENGKIMLLDVSKNQAKKLMASIDEYSENINDIAFTLKRVGTGKDTAYVLNPILKMTAGDQVNFDNFNGTTVELDHFVSRLEIRIPSEEFKIKMLAQAGFPVEEHKNAFGAELVEKALAPTDENATKVDENPEDVI